MLAVGNNELGGPIERRIKCDKCDDFFPVKDSEEHETYDHEKKCWVKSGGKGLLQFYTCNCGTFLVGINGKALP